MSENIKALLEGKPIQVLKPGVWKGRKYLERDIDEIYENALEPDRLPRLFVDEHKSFEELPDDIELTDLFPDLPIIRGKDGSPVLTSDGVAVAILKPERREDGLWLSVSDWLIDEPGDQLKRFQDISGEYFYYENEGQVMRGATLLETDHPVIKDLKHSVNKIAFSIKEVQKMDDGRTPVEKPENTPDEKGKFSKLVEDVKALGGLAERLDTLAETVKAIGEKIEGGEPKTEPVVAMSAQEQELANQVKLHEQNIEELKTQESERRLAGVITALSMKEIGPEAKEAFAALYKTAMKAGDKAELKAIDEKIDKLPAAKISMKVFNEDGPSLPGVETQKEYDAKIEEYKAAHKCSTAQAIEHFSNEEFKKNRQVV